jgi:hypothetical protein
MLKGPALWFSISPIRALLSVSPWRKLCMPLRSWTMSAFASCFGRIPPTRSHLAFLGRDTLARKRGRFGTHSLTRCGKLDVTQIGGDGGMQDCVNS